MTPGDATIFLAAPAVIGGAALLASNRPARRSSRVSPVVGLRD